MQSARHEEDDPTRPDSFDDPCRVPRGGEGGRDKYTGLDDDASQPARRRSWWGRYTSSSTSLSAAASSTLDQEDPRWRSQLDQLAADVLAWTGNHAGISEVGESELSRVR